MFGNKEKAAGDKMDPKSDYMEGNPKYDLHHQEFIDMIDKMMDEGCTGAELKKWTAEAVGEEESETPEDEAKEEDSENNEEENEDMPMGKAPLKDRLKKDMSLADLTVIIGKKHK